MAGDIGAEQPGQLQSGLPAQVGGGGLSEDQMARIQSYLTSLQPEEQEAFLDAVFADYEGEENIVERQRGMADELRDTGMPEMRGIGSPIRTAPNPLEYLSTGMSRYRGERKGVAAEQGMQDMSQRRALAQRQMGEALRYGR